ncbi:protein LURP-one-related 8-like [Ananas comosus]|uniref:Protein LURP-one-related 8 n=1 Tax=Ananas comosus TaxID=4615 RepID=A0A199UNN3_ANACO|nr:protein LURP-one-related 8-like [Ananas comosus]OAY66393.1 Protein LURP-one-related 8 [Ananas comosus]
MTKVYPNAASPALDLSTSSAACCGGGEGRREEAAALTVWTKSLLFNCSGFTVFDAKGNLVYRVDNYGSGAKGEVVLMDAAGKALLTIRRKRLSLGDHWVIYDGEETIRPLYSVKRHMNLRHSKALAHVTPFGGGGGGDAAFEIEGSYARRSCVVYDARRRAAVAEVRRKEAAANGGAAFGADVFRFVVQPELDASLAMAIVIVLDQMFGPRPSLIRSWSS